MVNSFFKLITNPAKLEGNITLKFFRKKTPLNSRSGLVLIYSTAKVLNKKCSKFTKAKLNIKNATFKI